jgi:transposase
MLFLVKTTLFTEKHEMCGRADIVDTKNVAMEYTKIRRRKMSERQYRTYAKEFKLEALQLLESSGKSAGQVERELGITPGLLLKWRARYQVQRQDGQGVHLEPSNLEAAKAEIRRLRRELALVEEEREILKKAVNIFSRSGG